MEFAGNQYVYFSKKKKDKIKKLIESNRGNAGDAPNINQLSNIIEVGKSQEQENKNIENKDNIPPNPLVEDKKDEENNNKMEIEKEEEKKAGENDNKMEIEKEEEKKEEEKKEDEKKEEEKKEEEKKEDQDKVNELRQNLSVASADSNSYIELNDDELSKSFGSNEDPVPPILVNQDNEDNNNKKPVDDKNKYKQEADTNVMMIKFSSLSEKAQAEYSNVYKCQKCGAYLNLFSNLNLVDKDNNKYEWICEFCSNINKDIQIINKDDIPINNIYEYYIEKPNNFNPNEDYSLIFCYDVSGSMCQSYEVSYELKRKFENIRKNLPGIDKKKKFGNINFNDGFDYDDRNQKYVSRLDLVKFSVENNINTLLKSSPNVKVGLVSFGTDIEVKGDCCSNVMHINKKDMDNQEKIISLGEENFNLIKNPISKSKENVLESLRSSEENGQTALGPAMLLSLSLLKNAKPGSRIFLCTDGCSNLGVGDISANRDEAIKFYEKLGDLAKERSIVINLTTFQDSESEIDVLMKMIEKSGGEILRVDPKEILDGFNDLLENKYIASQTKLTVNLKKCLTFRNEDISNLINDKSSFYKEIGNVNEETETYLEFKFKKAFKLAEMTDINFDQLAQLIFQSVIEYKDKCGGKCIRTITKMLKISDNKEIIDKNANFNIVSVNAIQKTANIAKTGDIVNAQVESQAFKKFLNAKSQNNQNASMSYQIYHQNMRDFNRNLYDIRTDMREDMMLNNNNNFNNYEISAPMMMPSRTVNNNRLNFMNNNMINMNNNMNYNMNNNNVESHTSISRPIINSSEDQFFQNIYSHSHTSAHRSYQAYKRTSKK